MLDVLLVHVFDPLANTVPPDIDISSKIEMKAESVFLIMLFVIIFPPFKAIILFIVTIISGYVNLKLFPCIKMKCTLHINGKQLTFNYI